MIPLVAPDHSRSHSTSRVDPCRDSEADSRLSEARFNVDHNTNSFNAIEMAFLSRQIDGCEPHSCITSLGRSVAVVNVLPADFHIERSAVTDSWVRVLGRSRRGSVMLTAYPRSATVHVCAANAELARALVEELKGRVSTEERSNMIPMRIWHLDPDHRVCEDERTIEAPTWQSIGENYPDSVHAMLEQLMATVRPAQRGKLILWHGAPGTGKTTALRALLRAWEPWCSGQYITDPERFFTEPGYIARVLAQAPSAPEGPTLDRAGQAAARWRLVIAEDSDEYLRATARRDAGAALGRLLNLTDGVLGQGMNTLVLLTTNEELNRLHPALTRPGRCLATVEFAKFSPGEASRRLPPEVPPPATAMTLAELLEMRGDIRRVGDVRNDVTIGQYL